MIQSVQIDDSVSRRSITYDTNSNCIGIIQQHTAPHAPDSRIYFTENEWTILMNAFKQIFNTSAWEQ